MENHGKTPNTKTALEVTPDILLYITLRTSTVFRQVFIPTKDISQGQAILQLTSSMKENFLPSLSTAFRKEASRLKEGGVWQGNLRTIDNLSFLKKYVHTPAQNIPWHVKIKSFPLTSPGSLTTRMIQTHHQHMFTINTAENTVHFVG